MGKKDCQVNHFFTSKEYIAVLQTFEKQSHLTLDTKRILGKGGYSVVYPAKTKGGNIFAVKMITIPKIKDPSDKKEISKYYAKVNIAKQDCEFSVNLLHKSIVRSFYSMQVKNDNYAIVMQKGAGSLNNIITHFYKGNNVMPNSLMEKNSIFNQMGENLTKYFFNQIVSAMMFLKECNCVHFDIKPDNFLLFGNEIKLSDFGLCYKLNKKERQFQLRPSGTFSYLPPEFFSKNPKINIEEVEKIDVFGLGCILFRMLNYNFVIDKEEGDPAIYSEKDIEKKIMKSIEKNHTSQRSDKVKQFIDKMLEPDISKRASMNDVFQNDWRFEGKNKINFIEKINSDDNKKLLIELQKIDYLPKQGFKKRKFTIKVKKGK